MGAVFFMKGCIDIGGGGGGCGGAGGCSSGGDIGGWSGNNWYNIDSKQITKLSQAKNR